MKHASFSLIIGFLFGSFVLAADWPQWRGALRDGISRETGLLQEWPEGGPKVRWEVKDIGTGYSSPAIARGRVYLQTTHGDDEFLVVLNETDGAKVYEVPIGKVGKNMGPQYPGTRSTPTVDGDLVYCLASDGELTCLDAGSGSQKWQKNLRTDFDGKPGAWAFSESVLIDGDTLVCTPGGKTATLAALNKHSGATIWKSPIPDDDNAEYASIMIVEKAPTKEYVQFLRKGLVGVDAKTGKFLWRYDHTIDPGANILTPIVDGDRIFCAGSRKGGGLIQLKKTGDGVTAEEIYFKQPVAPGIGGAVLIDGLLYGTAGQTMHCADFATGDIKWTDRAVGPASLCFADGRLYVRGHNSGEVVLVEPSAEGYREKGRLKQPDRSKTAAWPHPVVANGGLYLRDQDVLVCYDVSAASGK